MPVLLFILLVGIQFPSGAPGVVFDRPQPLTSASLYSSRAQVDQRAQHLAELERFSRDLTAIILEERVEDLIKVLDYEVTVDLTKEMAPAAVAQDLRRNGELYCRLFNTGCARRTYGPTFLSVKDVITARLATPPVIRFFKDIDEDIGFGYIEYMNQRDSARYGWKAAVMVEMEKVGGRWRIRALFPFEY